jgi:ribosome maturation factor RimP
MITAQQVEEIVKSQILSDDYFLVDLHVKPGNEVTVLIDKYDGITLDECVALSRKLETLLNRDEEDFALNVSSPGINRPFKVLEQYIKNKGRLIEVVDKQGKKIKGKLIDVKNDAITVAVEKNNGKQNKDDNIITINLNDIKRAKECI